MALTLSTQVVTSTAPEIVQAMSPRRFMDLSTDVKTLIISNVTRPTDMKNLCLTCKQLHEITVRQLYYEVAFDLGRPSDVNIGPFLSPKNIGLKYIRNLELYHAEIGEEKCFEVRAAIVQQAHFATRMILEFLPENILKRFSWHPWESFSADNLLLLYKKQRRMQWFEGITLDRDILPALEKDPLLDNVFANGRKLGMFPDKRESLKLCHHLLVKMPKVEKIILHVNWEDSEDVNDTSTGPGLITRTIFSHMLPFSKCTPLALKDITLQSVSLRYASDTYCSVLDFRTIERIGIFNCPGADALLAQISKGTHLPVKLEKLEFKHEDNREYDGLNALDEFLCLVSGIRTLVIDISNVKTLPKRAGIVRHGKTLTTLNVHAYPESASEAEEHSFDRDSFNQLVKHCTLLEQLSIAFPPSAINGGRHYTSDPMTSLTHSSGIARLTNLVTLNITTWPKSPSSRLSRDMYEHILQRYATDFFQRAAGIYPHAGPHHSPRLSKLTIVAFGASDKCFEREESRNLITFVQGEQRGPFGRTETVAVRCSWNDRKFAEPRSDVLEFSLSKSEAPPTREGEYFHGLDEDDSD